MYVRCTAKRPPVAGCRAISPMAVEKVVRSSWANWGRVWSQWVALMEGRSSKEEDELAYVGGSEHPAALGAVGDCDAGEREGKLMRRRG